MPKAHDTLMDEAIQAYAGGHVKVELIDLATDTVVQIEEGDNFISIIGVEQIKSQIRAILNQFNVNTVTALTDPGNRGRPGTASGYWPFWHIAYWNDATAEAPTTETHPRAPILGAALKINTGSVAGRRGLPNLSEGSASHESCTFVFEWTSANGNGTFQSVGWVGMPNYASGGTWNTTGAPNGIVPHPTAVAADFAGSFLNFPVTFGIRGLHYETGGSYWVGVRNAATWDIHSVNTTTGLTSLVVAIPNTMAAYNVSQGAAYNLSDICRIGTDWYTIAVSTNSTGSSRIGKMNAAGAQQFSVTHDGGASEIAAGRYASGICTDGSNLYVGTCLSAGAGPPIIYQIDTTTGLISATITPDAAAIAAMGGGVVELTVDSSYFYAISYTSNLVKLDKSTGALVGCPVTLAGTGESGTAVSPHTTTAYTTGSAYAQAGNSLLLGAVSASSNVQSQNVQSATHVFTSGWPGNIVTTSKYGGGFIVDDDGMLVVAQANTQDAPSNTVAGMYVVGHKDTDKLGASLGSRVLLDNPVTKTSSHGLKISYTIEY